ncbi:F-box/LRR-repeat protein 2 [Nematostella vectensis]|uniref:F-box/LRR-repeat protein 2 n=1 Tax=Nematostella vectensis TaxID=45351 RepID=UPI001390308F|nr:F-box/LRR-repeat protein 2 [Nematostella vectensis]
MTIKTGPSLVIDIFSKNRMLETVDLSNMNFCDNECSGKFDVLLIKLAENCPQLKKLVLTLNQWVTNEALTAVFKRCSQLRVLVLNSCLPMINESTFEALAENCKQLHQLEIADCEFITAKVLSRVFQANPYLEIVYLSHTSATDDNLSSLGQNCKSLKSIILSQNTEITQVGYMKFFGNCVKLHSVDLRLTNIDDESLAHLGLNCRNLCEVKLYRCDSLSPVGLCNFFKNCPSLKSIDLTDCPSVNNECIVCLANYCPGIIEVLLHNCNDLTSKGFQKFFRQCPQLETIDMSFCKAVNDLALICLSKNCLKLKVLIANACRRLTSHGVKHILMECTELQVLELCDIVLEDYCFEPLINKRTSKIKELSLGSFRFSCFISPSTLSSVLSCCPELEEISFTNIDDLSDEWIMWLAETFPRLKDVSLMRCSGLTNKSYEVLLNKCPEVDVDFVPVKQQIVFNTFRLHPS